MRPSPSPASPGAAPSSLRREARRTAATPIGTARKGEPYPFACFASRSLQFQEFAEQAETVVQANFCTIPFFWEFAN